MGDGGLSSKEAGGVDLQPPKGFASLKLNSLEQCSPRSINKIHIHEIPIIRKIIWERIAKVRTHITIKEIGEFSFLFPTSFPITSNSKRFFFF